MISRREFVKIGAVAGMSAGAFSLMGCGNARNSGEAEPEPAPSPAPASSTEPEPSPEPEPEPEPEPPKPTSIVVYFSRAGENYSVGTVTEGNTAVLAKMIAEKTGSDVFEIVPTEAYPTGYQACCDQALAEQHANARPAFNGSVDLTPYDTVYLGYPIWWGDLPMTVYTFLESASGNLNGKQVHPFMTHEGSGLSGTPATLRRLFPDATVDKGWEMTGHRAQNDRAAAEKSVDGWLGL